MGGYLQAPGALGEVVPGAAANSSEVGLHSLRVGATNAMAAGVKCHKGGPREKVDGNIQSFPTVVRTSAIPQRTRVSRLVY